MFDPDEDTNTIDLGSLAGKAGVDKVEDRLFKLLSSSSPHTQLEVTLPKSTKGKTMKPLLTAAFKE